MIPKTKPNFIDRLVGFVDPSAGIKRIKAREALALTQFSYNAAKGGRDRALVPTTGNSSSEAGINQRDRIQLIWEARALCYNFPLVKGLINNLALYSFGSLRYQPRTGDKNVDRQYSDYLNYAFENCDVTRRHNLTTLANLVFKGMLRDGDIGVVVRWTPEGPMLQLVESDCIGRPLEAPHSEVYIGGITRDPNTGAPLLYRVYYRTREGLYIEPVEIEANRFFHVFDPSRIDQMRGVTALDAAIDTARDIYDIMQYEKFAVKWASAQTGVITREEGEPDEWETKQGYSEDGKAIEELTFGRLNYLKEGENIQSFMSQRPSSAFSGFISTLQRDVCHAIGAPYGFFVDNSALGGNAGRMDSQKANRVCERYQNLMCEKFLNKVKDLYLAWGISQGIIPAVSSWRSGKWQFPAWPTADIGRDSDAAINEFRIGLRTAADIYAEQNKDWEEEFEQIGREQELLQNIADRLNLPVDRLSQRNPNILPDEEQNGKQPTKSSQPEEKKLQEVKKKDPAKVEAAKKNARPPTYKSNVEASDWEHKIAEYLSLNGIEAHVTGQAYRMGDEKYGKTYNPSDIHATIPMTDGKTRDVCIEVKTVGLQGVRSNRKLKITSKTASRNVKHMEAARLKRNLITIAVDALHARRDASGKLQSIAGARFFVFRGVGNPRLDTKSTEAIATGIDGLIDKLKNAQTAPIAGKDIENSSYFV